MNANDAKTQIYCGMCGDTGLQNGQKCPQIGCRKANGLPPFDAKTQGLPEMIAERIAKEVYGPYMATLNAEERDKAIEPLSALIREELLASELVKAAELYLDLHNSGKPGITDYNRLRAALNALKGQTP